MTAVEPTENPPQTYRSPTEEDRRICRAEFVAGKGYASQIAARHNLSPFTVKGWSIDGKWVALRDKREQAELAKLDVGLLPTEQLPVPARHELSEIEILQGHIRDTDAQLRDCTEAKERALLASARADFASELFRAIHGARPGTMRPSANKSQRRPAPASPIEAMQEQAVAPQANPVPNPPLSVSSVNQATIGSVPDDWAI